MYSLYFKNILDKCLALVLLILLLPLFVIIAIALKLLDPGPVFFRQQRVGYQGEVFGMFKFRSMKHQPDSPGNYATAQNDPRITPVGNFLRKTSVDELPQLINVLKGEMSFIGPRPDVPAQESLYTSENWIKRHQVKPGISGLAQATGRSQCTAEFRLAQDLSYVDNISLKLDIKIVILTLKTLASSRYTN